MVAFIKEYWDIIGGVLAGLGIAALAKFELLTLQVCYSVIILIIVCIGFLRLIRQSTQKKQKDRRHTAIDAVVDGQKPIKAIGLAQSPVEEGEKIGKKILSLWEGLEPMRDKFKRFFSRFKGYTLAAALAVLTGVEMCGGVINSAFGGVLTIGGVAVLPLATLVCAVLVGAISNGFTKEQLGEIKALFSKSDTNELVHAEIKKQLSEKTTLQAQLNKELKAHRHELADLESELEALNRTMQAKREMFAMVPQLATAEDVQQATAAVAECEAKIAAKEIEISETEATVDTLTTTISALRSQL